MKFAEEATEPGYAARGPGERPVGVEALSRASAIRRAGRAGFARNVCVAMGNWLGREEEPAPEAVAALLDALSDPEPLVRGHAAWALGQLDLPNVVAALDERGAIEPEKWVA